MPACSSRFFASLNWSAVTEMARCWTPPMVSCQGGCSWPGKSKNPSRLPSPMSKKKWLEPA